MIKVCLNFLIKEHHHHHHHCSWKPINIPRVMRVQPSLWCFTELHGLRECRILSSPISSNRRVSWNALVTSRQTWCYKRKSNFSSNHNCMLIYIYLLHKFGNKRKPIILRNNPYSIQEHHKQSHHHRRFQDSPLWNCLKHLIEEHIFRPGHSLQGSCPRLQLCLKLDGDQLSWMFTDKRILPINH